MRPMRGKPANCGATDPELSAHTAHRAQQSTSSSKTSIGQLWTLQMAAAYLHLHPKNPPMEF